MMAVSARRMAMMVMVMVMVMMVKLVAVDAEAQNVESRVECKPGQAGP